jgi:hypothetical protein
MVEAGNQALRDDLQWLIDRRVINLSTSTWPIPLSALEAALSDRKREGLSRGDVHALLTVERYVKRQQETSYGLTVDVNTDSTPQLGFDKRAHAKTEGSAYLQASSGAFAGKLQVNGLYRPLTGKQSRMTLEGSYVSATFLGQVVYAGQLSHWWGPGQDGSLIWSNAGTAIPGIGLRRGTERAFETPWLSWIGP